MVYPLLIFYLVCQLILFLVYLLCINFSKVWVLTTKAFLVVCQSCFSCVIYYATLFLQIKMFCSVLFCSVLATDGIVMAAYRMLQKWCTDDDFVAISATSSGHHQWVWLPAWDFLSVFYGNHSLTIFELGAWDRQTDRRIMALLTAAPHYRRAGGIKIQMSMLWCCHHDNSHCDSSFDECRVTTRQPTNQFGLRVAYRLL